MLNAMVDCFPKRRYFTFRQSEARKNANMWIIFFYKRLGYYIPKLLTKMVDSLI